MQSKFAKLFETEKFGQIVAILQGSDESEGPEIRFFIQPKGLGVCSIAIESGRDDSDAWDSMQEVIDNMTEESAIQVVYPLFAMISEA